MGLIKDIQDKADEDEFAEILQGFIKDDDYIYDSWRKEKIFDYRKCIKRLVEILRKMQNANENFEI